MTTPWETKRLGDVLQLQRGFDLPAQDRLDGSIPIISSSGISGYHADARVSPPGVVTGRYGTLGEVFYLREPFWPLNTTLYVRDFKGNNPKFIYYLLKSLDLAAFNDKSSVPGINRNHVHELRVSIPDVPEQRAIAAVLGALDDKIELNRKMSQALEQIARALFDSWFVRFEPVHLKADGCPLAMDSGTASLFPDHFEDSVIGPIPAGWEVGSVNDLVSVTRELLDPSDWPDEEFDHYSIPAFDADARPSLDRGATIKSGKFVVPDGAILVSKLNPRIPRVWRSRCVEGRRAIASTEFLVSSPRQIDWRSFAYGLLSSKVVSERLVSFASGTSNSHQRASAAALVTTPIPIPPVELMIEYGMRTDTVLGRIDQNDAESTALDCLRDSLLPKVLSGQLRLSSDAETPLEC